MKTFLLYIAIAIVGLLLATWLDPVIPNATDTQGIYTGNDER